MKKFVTFLIFTVIMLVVFYFAGQDRSQDPSVIDQVNMERQLKRKDAEKNQWRQDSVDMRKKMAHDSLQNIRAVMALKAEITLHKRNASKNNFKRATAADLDSVVSILYPSPDGKGHPVGH